MPFPDEQLAEGEYLLVHERPHPRTLALPAAMFVLVCWVVGYLAALLRTESWRGIGWWVLAVLACGLILWFTVGPLLRWYNTHFVVTDRRVLVREGVFSRVGFEIPMSRINSVRFRQNPIERMFGCGTLSIESVADEPIELDDVPRVQRVRSTLYHASVLTG